MSYCRWACDGSDVYVYESERGFEIHVSKNGENFTLDTPSETVEQLLRIRAEGYIVPQYAIETLMEEAKDEPS